VDAVDRVNLACKDEVLALVGETGCGKSVVAHAIMGILPPTAQVRGIMQADDLRHDLSSGCYPAGVRGSALSLLMQNPHLSLDPLMTVGNHITEALRRCGTISAAASRARALEELAAVGFEHPGEVYDLYPHQLSGGMAQRAALCVATVQSPRLLIADEPTKSLDAKSASDMVELLRNRRERGTGSMLLITHDISLVEALCDRIAVMYCGSIVEQGDVSAVLSDPLHPYTRGFLNSHPMRGFRPIPGETPSMTSIPSGCAFSSRCPHAGEQCLVSTPELKCYEGRSVRCHRF
jgi:peptide/nickel transport system ATP-binding protein